MSKYSYMLSIAEIREWHAIRGAHIGDPNWARMHELGRKRSNQFGAWKYHWWRPNDWLSRAVSCFFKLRRDSSEAEHNDALFDGGEWSGPAHGRLWERNCEELARRFGFAGFEAFHKAVAERTTERWAYYNLN